MLHDGISSVIYQAVTERRVQTVEEFENTPEHLEFLPV